MISVIIPTLNAGATLTGTLASLLAANTGGMIKEVIVADGGSTDQTGLIAAEAGALVVHGPKGRGQQLRAGAAIARGEWLLFLHADTQLAQGWEGAAGTLMAQAYQRQAGVFRLRFDAPGLAPRLVAMGANVRARLFGLPYGDQGLLIARSHYTQLGGFAPIPLFEDVDLVRRIIKTGGRRALKVLDADAMTSATRYAQDGYFKRVIRNMRCLRLYFSGVDPADILEVYNGPRAQTIAGCDGKTAPGRAGKDQAEP